MATEVFNLRGENALRVSLMRFTADTTKYQTVNDSLVIYEVPAAKRAKVVVRLHSSATGNSGGGLSTRAYCYSYSSVVSSRAVCSGSLYIGSLNVASPSAATAWSTSASDDMIAFGYTPSLHVPDYMVGSKDYHAAREQLSETSTIAAFELYRPTTYYLAEGETIELSYTTTGYAQTNTTSEITWNAGFGVYYDFDIIEEDIV